ncbi:glutaredoxin family protein [Desulfallas sp. Bu1-1]|jgi:glutaredoxin 3|uniref:glutaredoxin family protein n=1 Tax=Desulfallas sp. Bu1-1 TaxID=2787620 RepID=UPI00189D55D1|nr:glutaredoxin family protein [Desulfallas sp. Bu1-1]MBF7083533.1 glutaredoxin family protein [Desulfallas sp. Bu1-1]
MDEVIIYTKTGCPYCRKAMEDYRAKNIQFKEVNTSEDADARRLVKEKYGAGKVPVIVEKGKVVSIGYQGGG